MTGLRAFDAVVRHGTLSGAARELHVTPAAISHQLRNLHSIAGCPLLYREGARFLPTSFGKDVIATLGDAFRQIRSADALLRSDQTARLHISAAYSFATLWLGPRLMEFRKDHPVIELHLQPSHAPVTEPDADVMIVHSNTHPDGAGWTLLFSDTCGVMGRADHPALTSDACALDLLAQAQLIHIAHQAGAEAGEFSWQEWCAAKGLDGGDMIQKGTRVSAEHLAVDMILRGDGLGLVSTVNSHHYLSTGRLATMSGSVVRSNRAYWLKRTAAHDTAAAAFETWMRHQLNASLEEVA
jgi:DNA-binding transcriptional LysR family regulator